jgi:hypothetical protein
MEIKRLYSAEIFQ